MHCDAGMGIVFQVQIWIRIQHKWRTKVKSQKSKNEMTNFLKRQDFVLFFITAKQVPGTVRSGSGSGLGSRTRADTFSKSEQETETQKIITVPPQW